MDIPVRKGDSSPSALENFRSDSISKGRFERSNSSPLPTEDKMIPYHKNSDLLFDSRSAKTNLMIEKYFKYLTPILKISLIEVIQNIQSKVNKNETSFEDEKKYLKLFQIDENILLKYKDNTAIFQNLTYFQMDEFFHNIIYYSKRKSSFFGFKPKEDSIQAIIDHINETPIVLYFKERHEKGADENWIFDKGNATCMGSSMLEWIDTLQVNIFSDRWSITKDNHRNIFPHGWCCLKYETYTIEGFFIYGRLYTKPISFIIENKTNKKYPIFNLLQQKEETSSVKKEITDVKSFLASIPKFNPT